MIRLQFWFSAFLKAVGFIRRYRERQEARRIADAAERAREREHQRLLIEGVAKELTKLLSAQSEPLIKLAEASAAQAEVMSTWLKSFQVSDPTPTPSQTVRDEDEWIDEQRRKLAVGDPTAFPVDLPPELQLAYSLGALESFPDESFDREGRDFPS